MLLAASLHGKIVGTVQLGLDTPPNQSHRADIKKLLVHRSVRGHGVGAALMAQVEEEARRRGRWLLVLDTVPGENGYRLYVKAGWTRSGIIPDYALFPDGRLCDTAVFWKRLAPKLMNPHLPGFPAQHRLLAGDAPVIAG